MDFREADRRYAEFKRRHEAGTLNDEEFDEQLKQLMVQDEDGRWWVKSRSTGDWHYYDGTAWIKDTPPGYEPLQAASRVPSHSESVFISYRRDESAGYAGWIADSFEKYFGEDKVFRDIDSLEPGLDFSEAIERALESSEVLVAVIGKNWLTATDAGGQRRLENPDDFVRVEIATALKRNMRVIPVLVQQALMPSAEELPEDLVSIRRRQAIELHDTNWESDIAYLIAQVEKIIGSGEERTSSSARLEQRAPRDVAKGKLRVKRDDVTSRYIKPRSSGDTVTLFVDGEEIGTLVEGELIHLEIETGPHHLEVQTPRRSQDPAISGFWRGAFQVTGVLNPKADTAQKQHLTVDVHSGNVHDVICGFNAGLTVGDDLFIKQV